MWDVSEEWMGEGHDGVDVKCGPVVPWGEIKSQSVSDAEVLASMGLGPKTSAD